MSHSCPGGIKTIKGKQLNANHFPFSKSGYQDSNLGPPAPKAGALMLLLTSFNRLSISQLTYICFPTELKRLTSWLNLITKQEVLNNKFIISLWLDAILVI